MGNLRIMPISASTRIAPPDWRLLGKANYRPDMVNEQLTKEEPSLRQIEKVPARPILDLDQPDIGIELEFARDLGFRHRIGLELLFQA